MGEPPLTPDPVKRPPAGAGRRVVPPHASPRWSLTALLGIAAAAVSITLIVVIFLLRVNTSGVPESSERQNPDPPHFQSGGTGSAGDAAYPIRFGIGVIDPRFGLTRERLLHLVAQAASIWEKPVGLTLFRYDSTADFKINMVFDKRQQNRIDERRERGEITVTGKSFDNLKDEYESALVLEKELESEYQSELYAYNKRTGEYNKRVAYWNGVGEISAQVRSDLDHERTALDPIRERLDDKKRALDKAVGVVNALAAAINGLITKYNLQIENYNGEFVAVRDFEMGVFDGAQINIYEFDDDVDLRAVLVHELGHALGFGHAEDPASIMFYRLGKQDLKDLRLTDRDVQLLKAKVRGIHEPRLPS